jgi:phosphatidylglycerophosphatase A
MLAAPLGGWEIVLLVAVMLILISAKSLPDFRKLKAGEEDALAYWDRLRETTALWLAQGFGAGLAPCAPGTVGSLVGLLWVLLLVHTGSFWGYLIGTGAGLALSVVACGAAERTLRQHDPPSVVLDEIAALPLCFLPWVAFAWFQFGTMPTVVSLLGADGWFFTVSFFVLFRGFDVAKPWPVRQIQRLPGGWGITADDVLAAVYVALISCAVVGKAPTG